MRETGLQGESARVLEWAEAAGLASRELTLDDEGVLDWLKAILPSAATGAASGAALGPYGALGGAVLGALGGALQASQTAGAGGAATTQGAVPPGNAARPGSPGAGATAPAPAPAGAGQGAPELLNQLATLLPALLQAVQGAQRPRGEDAAEAERAQPGVTEERAPSAEDDDGSEAHAIDDPFPAEAQPEPEYPRATRFVPARFFAPRASRHVERIVIHITDGGPSTEGTVRWLANPRNADGTYSQVSAHYVVGRDGEVVQLVRNQDVAWHAHAANADSVGIEHVARAGGDGVTALFPTESQYRASARLVAWLCAELGIPADRAHIRGHAEADRATTHTGCPGAVWDWDRYMALVREAVGAGEAEASRGGAAVA